VIANRRFHPSCSSSLTNRRFPSAVAGWKLRVNAPQRWNPPTGDSILLVDQQKLIGDSILLARPIETNSSLHMEKPEIL
jgi:hypothetical protein